MRINYNLSAMITNSQLFRNEKGQQSAAERLASGLKINHAKDDPAGMAISNKMDVQIEGIRQASRNSSDGISVLESADSSLNEVTNIIQRMRELAVQAASDTNQIEDRQAIQAEIDSLSVEIDRISKNTEFNKKTLLDGSLSRRSYTNNTGVKVTYIGEGVPTKDNYGIDIINDAHQAVIKGSKLTDDTGFFTNGELVPEAAGRVTINGVIIDLEAGDSKEAIYEKLRNGAEAADVNCIATKESDPAAPPKFEETAGYQPTSEIYNPTAHYLVFVSKEYGSAEKMNIKVDNPILAKALGIDSKMFSPAKTSSASEVSGKTGDSSLLKDLVNPPVILNQANPAHKQYFDNGEANGKQIPGLFEGNVVDLAGSQYKKYFTFSDKIDAITVDLAGTIKIGGKLANINADMSAKTVYETIKTACNDAGVEVYLTKGGEKALDEGYDYSQTLNFRTKTDNKAIVIESTNERLSKLIGLCSVDVTVAGRDVEADFTKDGSSSKRLGYSDTATISTKGNKITVTDKNGFEIDMEVSKRICGTKWKDKDFSQYDQEYGTDIVGTSGTKQGVLSDITGYGMMTVHVGANENQIIDMDIPEVSTKSLGIDHLNLCSGYGADKALEKLDAALIEVSKVRSRLGAYQNRLESTVNSLNANDEDLTASVSRIRDVDMAQETTEYTQYTILVQAATSVLAQANELPQQALQLIQ